MSRKRKAQPRQCKVCGETFYKPKSHLAKWPARTCSRSCAAVLRNKSIKRLCLTCGSEFSIQVRKTKNGFGKYCSNACQGKAEIRRVTVKCRWCGADKSVTPYTAKSRKKHFCDLSCAHSWAQRFGTKKGKNAFLAVHKREWLNDTCCRCGSTSELELDHIIPRFAGGKAIRNNAQTLCRKCNREKFWREDAVVYSWLLKSDLDKNV